MFFPLQDRDFQVPAGSSSFGSLQQSSRTCFKCKETIGKTLPKLMRFSCKVDPTSCNQGCNFTYNLQVPILCMSLGLLQLSFACCRFSTPQRFQRHLAGALQCTCNIIPWNTGMFAIIQNRDSKHTPDNGKSHVFSMRVVHQKSRCKVITSHPLVFKRFPDLNQLTF